jgi:hypothetical protein
MLRSALPYRQRADSTERWVRNNATKIIVQK